jgi:hypothetical protein
MRHDLHDRRMKISKSHYIKLLITANSNTMGPYSTHMDAEFDAGFIVK